jgi:hypothetical protein
LRLHRALRELKPRILQVFTVSFGESEQSVERLYYPRSLPTFILLLESVLFDFGELKKTWRSGRAKVDETRLRGDKSANDPNGLLNPS